MRINILKCFFLVSLVSCQVDADKEKLLKPAKMEAVLRDYLRSEIYVQDVRPTDSTISDSSLMAAFQARVFSKHGVSKAQFIYSFEYYSNHGEDFLPIIDSMLAKRGAERTVTGRDREKLKLFKQQK